MSIPCLFLIGSYAKQQANSVTSRVMDPNPKSVGLYESIGLYCLCLRSRVFLCFPSHQVILTSHHLGSDEIMDKHYIYKKEKVSRNKPIDRLHLLVSFYLKNRVATQSDVQKQCFDLMTMYYFSKSQVIINRFNYFCYCRIVKYCSQCVRRSNDLCSKHYLLLSPRIF